MNEKILHNRYIIIAFTANQQNNPIAMDRSKGKSSCAGIESNWLYLLLRVKLFIHSSKFQLSESARSLHLKVFGPTVTQPTGGSSSVKKSHSSDSLFIMQVNTVLFQRELPKVFPITAEKWNVYICKIHRTYLLRGYSDWLHLASLSWNAVEKENRHTFFFIFMKVKLQLHAFSHRINEASFNTDRSWFIVCCW